MGWVRQLRCRWCSARPRVRPLIRRTRRRSPPQGPRRRLSQESPAQVGPAHPWPAQSWSAQSGSARAPGSAPVRLARSRTRPGQARASSSSMALLSRILRPASRARTTAGPGSQARPTGQHPPDARSAERRSRHERGQRTGPPAACPCQSGPSMIMKGLPPCGRKSFMIMEGSPIAFAVRNPGTESRAAAGVGRRKPAPE
jgi:hypothetical protein